MPYRGLVLGKTCDGMGFVERNLTWSEAQFICDSGRHVCFKLGSVPNIHGIVGDVQSNKNVWHLFHLFVLLSYHK